VLSARPVGASPARGRPARARLLPGRWARLSGALIGLALTVVPGLADIPAGPAASGAPLTVTACPVEVPGTLHRTLTVLGSWELSADHPDFGGLSGLLVEDGRLTAVTDRGRWLEARLALDGAALTLSEARIAPILTHDGAPLSRAGGDAEGLASLGPDLYVAFEQDHRVMRHLGGGRVGEGTRAAAFETLASNAGLEGLATHPRGGLIAIAEGPEASGFPMWRLTPEGTLQEATLVKRSRHDVTGADIDSAGRLFLVQRFFSPLTGVSMRVLRYPLGPDGWPDPARVTELGAWESASGIDNMEAIAVETRSSGPDRLWLLSDDNFNAPQRTLLLAFEIGG